VLAPDHGRFNVQQAIDLRLNERFEEAGISFAHPMRTVSVQDAARRSPAAALPLEAGAAKTGTRAPPPADAGGAPREEERMADSFLAGRIELVQDDLTRLQVDAIVNAANRTLLGGAGLDAAVHEAAGPELLEACRKLGGASSGDAKITPGFRTLITATPGAGRALAIKMARLTVKAIPDAAARDRLRPAYAEDAESLIAAAHVVAIEYATIAAADGYWRK